MVEPCSNQPISSPLARRTSGGWAVQSRSLRPTGMSRKRKPDVRHQDRRHRNERDDLAAAEVEPKHRALVLAVDLLDALQRARIDVPGIARDVRDLIHAAIVAARGSGGTCRPSAASVA